METNERINELQSENTQLNEKLKKMSLEIENFTSEI